VDTGRGHFNKKHWIQTEDTSAKNIGYRHRTPQQRTVDTDRGHLSEEQWIQTEDTSERSSG
jgi:hypothetical protein